MAGKTVASNVGSNNCSQKSCVRNTLSKISRVAPCANALNRNTESDARPTHARPLPTQCLSSSLANRRSPAVPVNPPTM